MLEKGRKKQNRALSPPGGLKKNGRGGEIRTHDLLYPKQARYQATLRPDTMFAALK